MKTVLFFGTFDPLHKGHRGAFFQAKSLGEYLIVVVARDSTIRAEKKRTPSVEEHLRLAYVAADASVDEAMLGDVDATQYCLLREISFDILALGYDQKPSVNDSNNLLRELNMSHVRTVRLRACSPEKYKSSLLRSS